MRLMFPVFIVMLNQYIGLQILINIKKKLEEKELKCSR